MSELDELEKKFGFKRPEGPSAEELERIIFSPRPRAKSPVVKEVPPKQIVDRPMLIDKEGDHRSCFPSDAAGETLTGVSSRYLDNKVLLMFDEVDIELMEKSPAKNLARFIKYRRQK